MKLYALVFLNKAIATSYVCLFWGSDCSMHKIDLIGEFNLAEKVECLGKTYSRTSCSQYFNGDLFVRSVHGQNILYLDGETPLPIEIVQETGGKLIRHKEAIIPIETKEHSSFEEAVEDLKEILRAEFLVLYL